MLWFWCDAFQLVSQHRKWVPAIWNDILKKHHRPRRTAATGCSMRLSYYSEYFWMLFSNAKKKCGIAETLITTH